MDAEVSPPNRRSLFKSAVTVVVNGQQFQSLRLKAGLTQEELARKAGYSDRLIRKAEASSPLRRSTVADLAEALSTPHRNVTVTDLTFPQETLALAMPALLLQGCSADANPSTVCPDIRHRNDPDSNPQSSESAVSLDDFVHPKFSLQVAGQELGIPFAGYYTGLSPCTRFNKQLVQSFGSVNLLTDQTRSFTSPGEICLHAITQIARVNPLPTIEPPVMVWWFLKIKFEANLITRVTLMYDTGTICRILDRISK